MSSLTLEPTFIRALLPVPDMLVWMVLGITCSTKYAFLSTVEYGEVVLPAVQRLEASGLIHKASNDLEGMADEIARAFRQIRPQRIVLLLPEAGPNFKQPYDRLAPRVVLETLIRLVSVQAEIPVETISRQTVRSKLKLPRGGELASHVPVCIPTPVGSYWAAGRDVASLAALAAEG